MADDTSLPRLQTELAPTRDPLEEALRPLKLTGVLYCEAWLTAPWGIDLPGLPGVMMVHIVNQGSAWLTFASTGSDADSTALRLDAGDLLVIPQGVNHQLRCTPDSPATPLGEIPIRLEGERFEVMHHGGAGALTRTTYCGIRFRQGTAARLLRALPRAIHVKATDGDETTLSAAIGLMNREARHKRAGYETVITRLADVIVIQAIRGWLESATAPEDGWVAALRDPRLGKALAAMHGAPGNRWTVTALAREAGLSRSSFCAHFTRLLDQPPMQYLTEWRMHLARERLTETSDTVGAVAHWLGYQSDAVFHRAYRRTFGESPGASRKRDRGKVAAPN